MHPEKGFNYLYFEVTNRCVMKCPRCPRTYEKLSRVEDLDVELFRKICSDSKTKNLEFLEFGGNYGDPIYHPDFIGLIKIAKDLLPQARLIVHTNGSKRKAKWWEELMSHLSSKDIVLFSIDGLFQDNSIYRVGSDWESLEVAIDICSEALTTVWKTIIFSFNEARLDEILEFARSKKFDYFLLVKSSLFGSFWTGNNTKEDPLKPRGSGLVNAQHSAEVSRLNPRCRDQSLFYVSPTGMSYRCTWLHSNTEPQGDYPTCFRSESFEQMIHESSLNLFEDLLKTPEKFPSRCHNVCAKIDDSDNKRSRHPQLKLELKRDLNSLQKELREWLACQ